MKSLQGMTGALGALIIIASVGAGGAQVPNAEESEVGRLIATNSGQQRPSMTLDPILSRIARARALDMATRSYVGHTNPDGFAANYLVRQAGYTLPDIYGSAPSSNNIESIAGGQQSPAAVVNAWLNSSSHRTHILGQSDFFRAQTSYGVGYAYVPGSAYGKYWVFLSAPPSTSSSPQPGSGAQSSAWQVVGAGEFRGAGQTDILWQKGGAMAAWQMQGLTRGAVVMMSEGAGDWQPKGIADLNRDGHPDIVWQNSSAVAVWLMNGPNLSSVEILSSDVGTLQLKAIGDLNGDGNPDIVWQAGGLVTVWLMNGISMTSSHVLHSSAGGWEVRAVADIDGDSNGDILWQSGGTVAAWLMNGLSVVSSRMLATGTGSWQVMALADLDRDGSHDILWQSGDVLATWLMNRLTLKASRVLN